MNTRNLWELSDREFAALQNDFADLVLSKHRVAGSVAGVYSLYRALQDERDDARPKATRLGQDVVTWQRAALILGEHLATTGPEGYYDFTPDQWLAWARDAVAKP